MRFVEYGTGLSAPSAVLQKIFRSLETHIRNIVPSETGFKVVNRKCAKASEIGETALPAV